MNNKVEPIPTIILIRNHHGKKAQGREEDNKEGEEGKEARLISPKNPRHLTGIFFNA
jgi:hypothetical protein